MRPIRIPLLANIAVCLFTLAAAAEERAPTPAGVPQGYRLVYAPDFAKPSFVQDVVFSDPKAWRVSDDKGGAAIELFGKSDYQPKFRSPFNIALLADRVFTDVIIDADICSTVKPYGHQDMCVFYGFESPTHFYYTHIAVAPDPHAHNCFIVNDAERKAIASDVSPGVTWGVNEWHHVHVDRRGSDGSITVFFDDMSKPIMRASDKTFPSGYIGFGSFDDMGKIRNVRIYAPSVAEKRTEFFQHKQGGSASASLTDAEKQGGWKLLFDGATTAGWRGLGMDGFPHDQWTIENGCFHCLGKPGKTNDLITDRKYENFELSFEWMVPKAMGNSGVKYRVQEQKGEGFAFGPEYQLMYDPGVNDKHATGSLYDVLPPKGKKLQPEGRFNESRIIVKGNHGEHWLNGVKVVEFDFASPELRDAVSRSKFKNTDWAKNPLGYIALQNHHDEVFFRNIKLRELPAPGDK